MNIHKIINIYTQSPCGVVGSCCSIVEAVRPRAISNPSIISADPSQIRRAKPEIVSREMIFK